ncbi:hypothetical protein [Rhizobium leguminosarum]|nr:hypothetical protein [Rhizobium leguminosarum]
MIRIEKRPEKDSPASLKVNYVKGKPGVARSIRAISALHIV